MDKYIGRLLDNRYEILEEIGSGGMAVVYKARCHRLNRLVAIKILKDDYLQDEEFKRRFHAESLAVAMLSHPNIVQVYDVFDSTEADYIVMELIDGISLKQYMEKKGVLNWKETLHFAMQIAKALEHAHSRGIVHRDIKPHNVMVLKNGSVKVTDFGIARMMSKGNTLTKEALGSVHYISPEQAKGGRVDNRSDIYSLGVVMYEMMTGKPPYDGESPVAVAIQHINGGAVMPSTLNPNVPGGLEQIIMKAMALEVSGRFRSAAEMLADLDEFRKDPAILFDYNTPPLDDVLHIQRKPVVVDISEEAVNDANHGTSGLPPLASHTPKRDTGNRPEMRTVGSRTSGTTKSTASRPTGKPTQPRRRPPSRARKSNKTTLFAIIGCSAAAVIALVILLCVLFLKSCGADVEDKLYKIPSFVGKTYVSGMSDPNFKIKRFPDEYHDTVPAGEIISQEPAAGEMKAEGTTIYLTVSKGKKETSETPKMPNVSRYSLESAKNTINSLGLNLGIVVKEEYHDNVTKGHVIRTEPEIGAELKRGAQITLYISMGKDNSTMDMFTVEGLSKEKAVEKIEKQNWNLKYEIIPEYVNTSIGYVLRSEPQYGEPIRKGEVIKLYVAAGDSPVVPAGLAGKTPETVEELINKQFEGVLTETLFIEYEVVEEYDRNVAIGKVTRINIEEGQPIANPNIPQKIIIYISKGPELFAFPVDIKVGDSYDDVLKKLLDIGFNNIAWQPKTGTDQNAGKIAALPNYKAGDKLLPETELMFTVYVEEKTVTFTFAEPFTGALKITKNDEVFLTIQVTDVTEYSFSDKDYKGSYSYKLYVNDGAEPADEKAITFGVTGAGN